jgi:hypothetical protein
MELRRDGVVERERGEKEWLEGDVGDDSPAVHHSPSGQKSDRGRGEEVSQQQWGKEARGLLQRLGGAMSVASMLRRSGSGELVPQVRISRDRWRV